MHARKQIKRGVFFDYLGHEVIISQELILGRAKAVFERRMNRMRCFSSLGELGPAEGGADELADGEDGRAAAAEGQVRRSAREYLVLAVYKAILPLDIVSLSSGSMRVSTTAIRKKRTCIFHMEDSPADTPH